jgi:hypothetical protein
LDGALYNNSADASVNFGISEGGSFKLFASDGTGSTSYFRPGSTFNLTSTFADGSTATASATVPSGQATVAFKSKAPAEGARVK